MMVDKMFYFTLGLCLAIVTCMVVMSLAPVPEGDFACSKCNLSRWYFRPAGGE